MHAKLLKSLLLCLAVSVAAPAEGRDLRALKAPQRTVIKPDANTVAHVYWNGTALVDAKGNAWTMNGTVPQVAKAPPVPAGAGPFAAGHYALGTGNDVLDFAGDFTLVIVYAPSELTPGEILVSNTHPNTSGYYVQPFTTNTEVKFGAVALMPGVAVAGVANVICLGRSGNTGMAKHNLGAIASASTAGYTPSANPVLLGRYQDPGFSATHIVIHELYATTTAISDALCTALAQTVKARLGVSAW